jgi:hypothetical protein
MHMDIHYVGFKPALSVRVKGDAEVGEQDSGLGKLISSCSLDPARVGNSIAWVRLEGEGRDPYV